jgi:hypothetical protein
MASKLPLNLHRNRYGILYFRLSIPSDLQQYFFSKEIYKSLRTSKFYEATIESKILSLGFKLAFSKIRCVSMSDEKKNAKEIWAAFLNLPDLRQRLNAAGRKILLEEREAEIARLENELINVQERGERDKAHYV